MVNKIIASVIPFLPKKFVWHFSKKYIAGGTIEDALNVSKKMNSDGMLVTVDLLGEFITNLKQADANRITYLQIIERFENNKIKGNYSLKPSFFGLLINKNICYQNIREIVKKAAEYNNFVRIDMEDSNCTSLEIELFKKLKKEFPQNVGIVIQAYLKRTLKDLKNMSKLHSENTPLNVRLCKGIYIESKEIAYQKYAEINKYFVLDLDYLLQLGVFVGIATHDKNLISAAQQLIKKYKVNKSKYEFQMLYGVTPVLQKKILDEGYTLRVYIPFGKDWFGYSTRRLKENPKIVSHILKSFFR